MQALVYYQRINDKFMVVVIYYIF